MAFNTEQMIEEYPFEICSTHFKKALDWISNNCENVDFSLFEGPDYIGMPKELYKKLSHDDRSYIQLYGNEYVIRDDPSLDM